MATPRLTQAEKNKQVRARTVSDVYQRLHFTTKLESLARSCHSLVDIPYVPNEASGLFDQQYMREIEDMVELSVSAMRHGIEDMYAGKEPIAWQKYLRYDSRFRSVRAIQLGRRIAHYLTHKVDAGQLDEQMSLRELITRMGLDVEELTMPKEDM